MQVYYIAYTINTPQAKGQWPAGVCQGKNRVNRTFAYHHDHSNWLFTKLRDRRSNGTESDFLSVRMTRL